MSDPNGTFVVATQPLPADLVITTAEIQSLRDQLKQEETQKPEDTQIPDDLQDQVQDSDTQTPDNEIIVMDTKEYEFVSEGSVQGGEVTFDIKHCSEYLITSENW